ncbi:type VII secretion protein EccB [Streptomyces sp. 4N509B]|uniref:type VII secretion protein EccB n=1 Tax=Streptomyces sp. 4N509B TaxID=3457413 RepID=UPI003FD0D086
MATTRELAEAYAYANRRMTTSLLRGTDEARLDPRRRLNRSLGAGVAVGVLVMAGFGIAGWLGGGRGPELPANGAVVAGDSSYVVTDGVVHPALNLASALLAGGGGPTEVRRETLDEAPRGLPVGIPGAPNALPDGDELLDGMWTLCAVPSETDHEPEDTALYVAVPGVAPAAPADATPAAAAGGVTVLVEDESGARWLLTEGRRYALSAEALGMLNLPGDPVLLPREIIDTVPEAPEITVPDTVPGAGDRPVDALSFDARVGDLAHTEAGSTGPRYFVVRPDGLQRVSELVYTLMAAHAGEDHPISLADAADGPPSEERLPPGEEAWPERLPAPAELERNQPVCVSTPPGGEQGDAPWRSTVHLPRTMPEPAETTPVEASEGEVPLGLLDRIYVPPGSGALVRVTGSSADGGTHTLVTDSGMAYPFASPEAVQRLGYAPAEAPSMPREYAELLPAGPLLDPLAAAEEQRGAAPGAEAAGIDETGTDETGTDETEEGEDQ